MTHPWLDKPQRGRISERLVSGVSVDKEVVALRGPHHKTFIVGQSEPGVPLMRTVAATVPLHWKDHEHDVWREIDLTTKQVGGNVEMTDAPYCVKTLDDKIGVQYSSRHTGVVRIELSKLTDLDDAQIAHGYVQPEAYGDRIIWSKVIDNVDIILQFTPQGVEFFKVFYSRVNAKGVKIHWKVETVEEGYFNMDRTLQEHAEERGAATDASGAALRYERDATETSEGVWDVVESVRFLASKVLDSRTRVRTWTSKLDFPVVVDAPQVIESPQYERSDGYERHHRNYFDPTPGNSLDSGDLNYEDNVWDSGEDFSATTTTFTETQPMRVGFSATQRSRPAVNFQRFQSSSPGPPWSSSYTQPAGVVGNRRVRNAGMWFDSLEIPKDATVQSALLKLDVEAFDGDPGALKIYAELGNRRPFGDGKTVPGFRPGEAVTDHTWVDRPSYMEAEKKIPSGGVAWTPYPTTGIHSLDVTSTIQELVDSEDWSQLPTKSTRFGILQRFSVSTLPFPALTGTNGPSTSVGSSTYIYNSTTTYTYFYSNYQYSRFGPDYKGEARIYEYGGNGQIPTLEIIYTGGFNDRSLYSQAVLFSGPTLYSPLDESEIATPTGDVAEVIENFHGTVWHNGGTVGFAETSEDGFSFDGQSFVIYGRGSEDDWKGPQPPAWLEAMNTGPGGKFGSPMTIELWAKWDTSDILSQPGDVRICRMGWYGFELVLSSSTGNLIWRFNEKDNGSAFQVEDTTNDWGDDQWHHIVGSWSYGDSTSRLFVDGQLIESDTFVLDSANAGPYALENFWDGQLTGNNGGSSGSAFAVGRNGPFDGGYFIGRINEVAIYDRALDAEEVSYHYNQPRRATLFEQENSLGFIPVVGEVPERRPPRIVPALAAQVEVEPQELEHAGPPRFFAAVNESELVFEPLAVTVVVADATMTPDPAPVVLEPLIEYAGETSWGVRVDTLAPVVHFELNEEYERVEQTGVAHTLYGQPGPPLWGVDTPYSWRILTTTGAVGIGGAQTVWENDFSVVAWVKDPGDGTFIGRTGAYLRQFECVLSSGGTNLSVAYDNLSSDVGPTGSISGGITDISDGCWHLVGIVYDDTAYSAEVFVDGVSQFSGALGGNRPVYTGVFPDEPRFEWAVGGDGRVSDAMLYDYKLTAANLLNLFEGLPDTPYMPDMNFHHAYWANDPFWTNPGDGVAVSQWDDFSGNGRHLTQGSAALQPVFDDVNANFGDRSSLHFDGADRLRASSYTGITPDVDGPSAFIVAKTDVTAVDDVFAAESSLSGNHAFGINSSDEWQYKFGGASSEFSNGTVDTSTHALYVSSKTDSFGGLTVDGTENVRGESGTDDWDETTLGQDGNGANGMTGDISLYVMHEGEMRDEVNWPQFIAIVDHFYKLDVTEDPATAEDAYRGLGIPNGVLRDNLIVGTNDEVGAMDLDDNGITGGVEFSDYEDSVALLPGLRVDGQLSSGAYMRSTNQITPGTDFSISWVSDIRRGFNTVNAQIILDDDADGGGVGIYVLNSGNMRVTVDSTTVEWSDTEVQNANRDGQYHNWTLTVESTTAILYLDGVSYGSKTVGSNREAAKIQLGKAGTSTAEECGVSMGQIAVWQNDAITPSQAAQIGTLWRGRYDSLAVNTSTYDTWDFWFNSITQLGDGVVYKLDLPSGTSASDSKPPTNTAATVNSAICNYQQTGPAINSASTIYSLENTDGSDFLLDVPAFGMTDHRTYTWFFWMKTTESMSFQELVEWGGIKGAYINNAGSGLINAYADNTAGSPDDSDSAISGTVINDGDWHLVAIEISHLHHTVAIWLDGVMQDPINVSGAQFGITTDENDQIDTGFFKIKGNIAQLYVLGQRFDNDQHAKIYELSGV